MTRPANTEVKFNWQDEYYRTVLDAGHPKDMPQKHRSLRFSTDSGTHFKGLDVTLAKIHDPRLLHPATQKLFARMQKEKRGTLAIPEEVVYEASQAQQRWVSSMNAPGGGVRSKWPKLLNDQHGAAQYIRNVINSHHDIAMVYFIVAGVKAGICTLDGWGDVFWFSTARREQVLLSLFQRGVISEFHCLQRSEVEECCAAVLSKEERSDSLLWDFTKVRWQQEYQGEKGWNWFTSQPWYRGFCGPEGPSAAPSWGEPLTMQQMCDNIPSEPEVVAAEEKCQREIEEREEKIKKERDSPEVQQELQMLRELTPDQFWDLIEERQNRGIYKISAAEGIMIDEMPEPD